MQTLNVTVLERAQPPFAVYNVIYIRAVHKVKTLLNVAF